MVLTAVLNGSLQARDRDSGALLWQFDTDAAKANRGWVLTSEGRFNGALTFPSTWHEATALAFNRQESVGSFYATPLVVNGVVYIGSADGTMYAID